MPSAPGVKVTLNVQLAPSATLEPQSFVSPNSGLMAILATVNGASPELLNVTVCGGLGMPTSWSPKARLDGERLTAGATPVPDRLVVCGLTLALSMTVIDPVLVPLAVGVNVTSTEHVAAPARLVPQSFVWA
jgi:hypothetical protein